MTQDVIQGGPGGSKKSTPPKGAPRVATLSPVRSSVSRGRVYKPVSVALTGDTGTTVYNQIGQGGWQVVDRPKMAAATEWFDRSPWQLVFNFTLDNEATTSQSISDPRWTKQGSSIERECLAMESWMDKVPGGKYPEAPVITLSGPLPGVQRQWVVYALEWDDALRDPTAGYRFQQNGKITLYEYNPVLPSRLRQRGYSPAEIARATSVPENSLTNGTISYLIYTVKHGDTMSRIAHLFHTTRADIMYLNGLHDPNSIVPGQLLSIPRPG